MELRGKFGNSQKSSGIETNTRAGIKRDKNSSALFLTLGGDSKVDPDLLLLERGLAAYAEVRAASLSAVALVV